MLTSLVFLREKPLHNLTLWKCDAQCNFGSRLANVLAGFWIHPDFQRLRNGKSKVLC